MSLFDKINLPQIYKVHSFTSGTSTFAVTGSGDVEVLVIGAGAGGSADNYGGGGSGGMSEKSGHAVTAQSYSVVVGTGGAGGVQSGGSLKGSNGNLSSFDSIVSNGGGAGGINSSSGNDGGSGGGCGTTTNGQTGGDSNQGNTNGATGYGFDGGDSPQSGGGGAGQVGQAPNGGNGRANSISGASVYYAGGGASVNGTGGIGGGGNGNASFSGSPSHGTANTGSGGGSGHASAGGTAGNGGSGVVIIRYLNSSGITATGGTISYAGVANQRVVENFSGSVLDTDRWTFRNITGTGTGAMGDSVDGGYEIKPSTGGTDQSQIDFNGIRQYSPTGCAMISVAKSIGVSPNHHVLGLINDYTLNISTAQTNSIIIDTSGASFRALSGDGSTWSSAGTVISKDNNWHNFKVEASSSNILYYADGLLRITKTTNRPTLPLQPRFVARYTSSTLSIRYAEAYNT
tara:strand:+ start:495 stop:1868 length:1374 start_codon:yes stop_codon:yes gene_type:complete